MNDELWRELFHFLSNLCNFLIAMEEMSEKRIGISPGAFSDKEKEVIDLMDKVKQVKSDDPVKQCLIEAIAFFYQVVPDLPYKVNSSMVEQWKETLKDDCKTNL